GRDDSRSRRRSCCDGHLGPCVYRSERSQWWHGSGWCRNDLDGCRSSHHGVCCSSLCRDGLEGTGKGLAGVAGGLALITLAMNLMPKGAVLKGAGILLVAAGL